MSLIKNILLKNYINDIYEASNGFFYSIADEVEFDDPNDIYSPIKFDMANKYGVGSFSVREIDAHFSKYLKYNKYDIMAELNLKKPVLKDVIQIYANDKVVYATLVMDLRIDVSDYVANAFYRAIKPQLLFSFLEEENEIKHIEYYIQVEFKIDEILKKFRVKNVFKYKPSPIIPEGGIKFDNNMVPDTDDYELLAKMMREKYKIVAPVDLETSLYEIGLNVDTTYSLDSKVHGLVCLSNGYITNDNKLIEIKENTILIDKDHIKNYGVGSYRFNVLHEMVHFEYHKYYLTLKRQLAGLDYAISDNLHPLKKIEEQANKVASLLLVPSEELYSMLIDKYMECDFFIASDKYDILNRISNQLSNHFKCSKTCMHQRIKSINIYTAGIDLTEIDNTYINDDEVKYMYNTNEEFRELIDTKQVVYNNKHCVINNVNNFSNNTITHYAYKNPRTSMLTFSRVHKNRYTEYDNFFAHITVTKELLDSVLKKIKDKKYNASIDIGSFINKVFEEDKYDDLIVGDLGKSIKRIRESKNIGYNTLSKFTGIDVKDLYKLEHNLVKNPSVKNVVLICKGLGLPKATTHLLVDKLGGFEKSIEDKAIEYIVDNNYDADIYEFYDMVQDGIKAAQMIEKENQEILNSKLN